MGRKAVYSDASHLEDGGSRLRAHLPLSVQVEVSIRRERGTEQRSRERLKSDYNRGTYILYFLFYFFNSYNRNIC